MRILNVTAQKPNSTGSGIFLSELMKEFANKGHTQALVAGVCILRRKLRYRIGSHFIRYILNRGN